MTLYPWQKSLWLKLADSRQRLPHALLLKGRNGIGKHDFALSMAKALLCNAPQQEGMPCEQCSSCTWYVQNSHPDFRLIAPEEELTDDVAATKGAKKSRQISVAQIRELSGFLGLSSHHDGGRRIVLISPAEALNAASANALLKILEEPPEGLIFILVTHQPYRLLPTIVSRCHTIDMPIPDMESALAWLAGQGLSETERCLSYAGGAPLLAVDSDVELTLQSLLVKLMSQGGRLDPFSAAPLVLANGMESAINAMQKWVYDLLALSLSGSVRYHKDALPALQGLCNSVDLGQLLEYQKQLNSSRKAANHPLNNEVQLESLLLQYSNLFTKSI